MTNRDKIVSFFERLFFKPAKSDWVIIALLSPLSLIYGTVMLIRRVLTPKIDYSIPIISVGNLTLGGSGKTPFTIALASKYKNVYIISRGHGRKSKGLVEVSSNGKILTDVFNSGDEAMLMAKSLPNSSIIVSENRKKAIELAKKRGATIIILDDGFNRISIKKFEILLLPAKIENYFPLPAGAFREFYFTKIFANLILVEGRDFKRKVYIKNPTERMLLVTAISNPQRLDPFLPKEVIGRVYLQDHAYFDKDNIIEKISQSGAISLLVTEKDEVKMEDFKVPLSIMELKIKINPFIFKQISSFNHL
jgi:tetraacyldisaccharide 4'-kinase